MSKSKLSRIRRVMDLFEEGQVVVLDEADPADPVLVWVNKLNPFEMDDARRDGSVGRARAVLRLDDPSSAEAALMEQAMADRTTENIAQAIASSHFNEDYVLALDDVRADPEWAPKVEMLERADQQRLDSGAPEDDEEVERLGELNQAYMAKHQEMVKARQDQRIAEAMELGEEGVREAYIQAYKEQVGSNGFLTEYRTTEIYYALRDCRAVPGDNAGWDHTVCNHKEKLCATRADVRELPGGLIDKVSDAITALTMTPREAGNSDAPASSSASSERPSAAAESTPSTPAAK